MHSLLLLLALTSCGLAQPRLPLEFDADPGWELLPTYLGNPAEHTEIISAGGTVTIRVSEPGRGMKLRLECKPFDVDPGTYLLLRYRAENLAGGYALWLMDDSPGGREVLNVSELIQDGQWHTVAVNLELRGAAGRVRSILTEVQCAGEPASISFDRIWTSHAPPEGATVIPAPQDTPQDIFIRGAELAPLLESRPDWLGSPAERFGASVQDGSLYLFAAGKDRGMKWSAMLPEPVDLGRYKYMVVRYRATGIAPWGDYFIWLGSGEGGLPDAWTNPLPLYRLADDGDWHLAVIRLDKAFQAVQIALEVSSEKDLGEAWLDFIRFSATRPLLDLSDVLAVEKGWRNLRAPQEQFRPIPLDRAANARGEELASRFGLRSWLPGGRVSVRGIPFDVPSQGPDAMVTPEDIDQTLEIPVEATGSELYLLLAAKLPPTDTSRLGDPLPMERFSNSERFVVRVNYADGVTDEIFPVHVGRQAHEIQGGPEVYCLPQLRSQTIRSLSLRNRMDSACFVVGGVTVNVGQPLTPVPQVLALPDPVEVRDETPGPGRVTATASGFAVENNLLRLELATRDGIRLERMENRCLQGVQMTVEPGPLFEIGDGETLLTSEQVTVGAPQVTTDGSVATLTIPVDGTAQGVPIRGELLLRVGDGPDILMNLNLTQAADHVIKPVVNFPLVHGMKIGSAEDTWYLWARKGGLINNAPTDQFQLYGGQYPLQVADVFGPGAGGGLALLTYDLDDIFRYWHMLKDDRGVTWRMDYWPYEHQPGQRIEVAPTALRAHTGDWRRALDIYRQWTRTWYRPHVPRKPWFQGVFYYQQVFAWSQLWKPGITEWPLEELVNRYRDYFGCLDYLHIFDFGASRVYGRVGDYNHYEELGGLEMMRGGIAKAQKMGVPVGLYIEGYLCDRRAAWGLDNILANDVRDERGNSLMYHGSTEHVMCPAALGWRQHLVECYSRAAGDLQPNGLYIDQYGFLEAWYICHSREHGHPVPWPPIRGERDTTRAIRDAVPPEIATLTEETPNDVNSQYQDGALGYSVTQANPALAPHRVNLFRFAFPSFKVFQLVNYNPFLEGAWDLLKWPFFNGDGYWLHGGTSDFYCEDAHQFLRQAFAILNRYEDAFCSDDVEPLVPTLVPTVYANRFTGDRHTVWTLFNGEHRTVRGNILRVRHVPGTRYLNAFTGEEIQVQVAGGMATIPLELGPQAVGCVVGER